MRILGEWWRCDDGLVRPTILAMVFGKDNAPFSVRFLIDTGADQTVFTAELLAKLNLPTHLPKDTGLRGLGGQSSHVLVISTIEFKRDDGVPVHVRAEFAALTDPAALDMSLLGCEVLNCFDLIVSRARKEILLLSQNHRYQVISP